ncbi:uncharacterized protein CANTADRAFT_169802 [Suhomyces tanzawaensis NRRL Y-17324]|uniref:Uncharacterized protein n=1 Tax=Suhomyces tanzawaensis NRRL Y-17324 TaxID=984487 RepID=A0A1E4SMF8_9ASCO|nr:uncharacterized protein CANTADRAFT_169802 [Suhomyces tanzawaensis NRRL Y-17324]ODV80701.1 hypothetical protein CANTADRAFT_169802 [Suhomyces tanzawaensis NRRL Y-17324]
MSGSSRSLIKALDSVFIEWNDDEPPSQLLAATSEVIRCFHSKHNTLHILKQSTSINDELFRIYNTYIKPDPRLSKESVFLVILRQLLCVLTRKEVHLWLKTYLKPAIDSAGYDLGFVAKARDFIRSVLTDTAETADPERRDYIANIEQSVGEILLEVYLGINEQARVDWLRLEVQEHEKMTQVHQERIRYIKHNSMVLIEEYGQKKPLNYLNLLNKHFVVPKERFETSVLISSFVASLKGGLGDVSSTPLLGSLIKCLLYDFNHKILRVTLSILTMIMPQLTEYTQLWPDLCVVMIRMLAWDDLDPKNAKQLEMIKEYILKINDKWGILNEDSNSIDFHFTGLLQFRKTIDYSPFGTLLYGLFPFNLKKLARAPLKFCQELKYNVIDSTYLEVMGLTSKLFENTVRSKLKKLLMEFRVHPKFVEFETEKENEAQDPFKWIRDAHSDSKSGTLLPEEISIACFNLHPDLMVDISDTILHSLSSKSMNQTRPLNNFGGSFETVGRTSNNSQQEFNHISRKLSIGSPVYFNVKDSLSSKVLMQQSFQNLSRKMSIIPTNMVIDAPVHEEGSEIKFKDTMFNEGVQDSKDRNESFLSDSDKVYYSESDFPQRKFSADYHHHEGPTIERNQLKSDPLGDLMSTHETLFGPKSKGTSIVVPTQKLDEPDFGGKKSTSFLGDRFKNDLFYSKHISSPTTSLETAPAHKGSMVSSGGSTLSNSETIAGLNGSSFGDKGTGTALEFYQRELLLVKNEYEFASFMKHMNKFRYIKLKLQMSNTTKNATGEHTTSADKSIEDDMYLTLDYLKELTVELKNENTNMKQELIGKLEKLREENELLKQQLNNLHNDKQESDEQLVKVLDEISQKDYELGQMRIKISEMESQKQSDTRNSPQELEREQIEDPLPNTELAAEDEKMYKLNTEIGILRETNHKMTLELEQSREDYLAMTKNYEKKLAASKLELNENINSFTSQYEKKIQELSTTLLKYETLLDEKNARLIQVLSSKPISIPSTPDHYRSSSGGKIPMRSSRMSTSDSEVGFDNKTRSNSSLDGIPHAPTHQLQFPPSFAPPAAGKSTTVTSNVQPVPIIRGRGGYQKRSKKLM